ncbi:hypothetical protein, partial [Planomonospora algeriensis]
KPHRLRHKRLSGICWAPHIQQLLGHWTVSSTMRYVRPSATFIEDAYRRAVTSALGELTGEGDSTA